MLNSSKYLGSLRDRWAVTHFCPQPRSDVRNTLHNLQCGLDTRHHATRTPCKTSHQRLVTQSQDTVSPQQVAETGATHPRLMGERGENSINSGSSKMLARCWRILTWPSVKKGATKKLKNQKQRFKMGHAGRFSSWKFAWGWMGEVEVNGELQRLNGKQLKN